MGRQGVLVAEFEAARPHLRAVAFRLLGSLDDADDAVQQTWLRTARADLQDVENVRGWLTTAVSRICLDILRARGRRAEGPLALTVEQTSFSDEPVSQKPEEEVILAESVGLALMVVLDRLTPAQRVAFVLHDLFSVPFDDIAPVVERTPVAAKKLASRARERVRGAPTTDAMDGADLARRYRLVEAFLAASREGDLDRLLELLAPGVVRVADSIAMPGREAVAVRGAQAVAKETRVFRQRAQRSEVALVGSTPGIVVAPAGRLFAVLRIAISGDRITHIEVIADPAQLARTEISVPIARSV